ncbi:MAG: HPr family phosphocarrier protein [Candidatus Limnocylindrus sp.]|jgi:phosphotransferase system HPr (HPr) family protein
MTVHEATALVPEGVGLHARPAALFVQMAAGFESSIRLTCGDRSADGKSILGVLQLGASAGSQVTIQAEGGDAEEAAERLATFIREIS